MKIKRLITTMVIAAAILTWTASASAFVLSMEGLGGAALDTHSGRVLYASDARGRIAAVASIGVTRFGGATIEDLGLPTMMPDGSVVFGAELSSPNRVSHWEILIANSADSPPFRLRRLLDSVQPNPGCAPVLRVDPRPVAASSGEIAFIAGEASGADALFLYSKGTLSCLSHAGDYTLQHHRISILGFGSQDPGPIGQVAFNAWISPDVGARDPANRQAVLLASAAGISEVAVQGKLGPERTRYDAFGLPSAVSSDEGMMIAFVSKTPSGAALFLYHRGEVTRVLTTGTMTALAPVTNLGFDRPALIPSGMMAVHATCARMSAILTIRDGRLSLPIQRGQLTPFGTEFRWLGDPALTDAGALYLGASDSEGINKIFVLGPRGGLFTPGASGVIYQISDPPQPAISSGSPIPNTLSINARGDFAYLG
ncbi:MAG TPA: hypothetical protein VMV27_04785 [Candidatus Binataceae bacterium]|nr:hypothetical protein [Candidatus Binataceae bacterium]